MTKYVVLIRPQGEGAQGEATVHVETDPPAPRITEMTIRSVAADGAPMLLPSIDLEGVVAALAAGIRGVASPAANEVEVATPAATPQAEPALAPAGEVRTQEGAKRTRTPARDKAAKEKAATTRGASDRPYRHMPAVEELQAAYEKAGTVTGVAEHYGVPRHTAQGWMARLRKLTS